MPNHIRRALIALGVLLCLIAKSSYAPEYPAHLKTVLRFPLPDKNARGFSGFAMKPDGHDFIAVLDRGFYLKGKFIRDQNEDILRIHTSVSHPIILEDGASGASDTEAVALAENGGIYIAREGRKNARILYYHDITKTPIALPHIPQTMQLFRNSSLESVGLDAGERVYTVPERFGQPIKLRFIIGGHWVWGSAGAFPIWRYNGQNWETPYTLPIRGDYVPVALDFGPDRRLYVLERAFRVPGGFTSRLRRFSVKNDSLTDERILMQSAPGVHDNLEGMHIWEDRSGGIRATLISDDNTGILQRSELVEYRFID